ncbi:PAS domain-containing sensor histidine kinase, partial [Streptomyces sp. WAC04770]
MAVGMSSPGPAHTAAARVDGPGIDPDDLPDGLVVADESGRVVCFNAAAARITAT